MTTKKQAQALAIKLSRERRAGKEIPPPPKGKYSEKTRQRALHDLKIGRHKKTARKRPRIAEGLRVEVDGEAACQESVPQT